MKERILITGASGFVGYHLILVCLNNGFDVYAAVRKNSNIKHLETLNLNFTELDFENINALKQNINTNRYNYILHAAGITKAFSEQEYNKVNAGFTYNLATAASGTQLKKFILISSLAAIGPLNTLAGKITEQTVPAPLTAYGRSKLLAERQLQSVKSLDYTVLRPTGVYGPRDKDIFIMFKQIANGIEPYIGRRQQKLSLIYVADLATAALSALKAPSQSFYNLSDGNAYGREELAEFTKQILRKNTFKLHLPVLIVKLMAIIAENYGILVKKAAVLNPEKLKELMAVNWDCSIEKARSEIAFNPSYNLKTGLQETLNWYQKNNWL